MATKQDFEKRYYDQIDEFHRDIKGDIREVRDELRSNTNETKKINSRLTKVEDEVFPIKKETIQQLPPWYRDPQLIKLFLIVATGLLFIIIIVAAIWGVPLPKGLF